MPVEVSEQVMDVLGGGRVSRPFLDIEGQERLVGVMFAFLQKLSQMSSQVVDELVVELFS